jgi:hypothetical protein
MTVVVVPSGAVVEVIFVVDIVRDRVAGVAAKLVWNRSFADSTL